jgi:hypothetical protein
MRWSSSVPYVGPASVLRSQTRGHGSLDAGSWRIPASARALRSVPASLAPAGARRCRGGDGPDQPGWWVRRWSWCDWWTSLRDSHVASAVVYRESLARGRSRPGLARWVHAAVWGGTTRGCKRVCRMQRPSIVRRLQTRGGGRDAGQRRSAAVPAAQEQRAGQRLSLWDHVPRASMRAARAASTGSARQGIWSAGVRRTVI